jgi:SprT protein
MPAFPAIAGPIKAYGWAPGEALVIKFRSGLSLQSTKCTAADWALISRDVANAAQYILTHCISENLAKALNPSPRFAVEAAYLSPVKAGVDHLLRWIPPETHAWMTQLVLERLPCVIYCVAVRKSKHGDHWPHAFGSLSKITISICGNAWQQFITTVHELAHNEVTLRWPKKRLEPHGQEWQLAFQRLLVEALERQLFPAELRGIISEYASNPKSSSSRDIQLQQALRPYDTADQRPMVSELAAGSWFSFDGKLILQKGEKIRTQYRCLSRDGQSYRVNPAARVSFVYNTPS